VDSRVQQELEKVQKKEQDSRVRYSHLELMRENIKYAQKKQIPVCQDTGLINLFIQMGAEFPHTFDFQETAKPIIQELTQATKLRPNTVDPITHHNPQNNSGLGMPPIYLELKPNSSDLTVTVLNKGGGSENMSALFMLTPSLGLDQFIPMIVDHMKKAGGKPCPPTILGIGIGGDACKAMYLAKKTLFRPFGIPHSRSDVAKLEKEILTAVNEVEIGVMGLGGHTNCLDAKIEISMRHPASFPVGLIVECYCHRKETFQLSSTGQIRWGELDENYQFQEKK
jgi:fumarate hydratase subunit alpha